MSDRTARFLRRAAARAQARLAAAEPRQEDRRQEERRAESLSGAALDRRLRELGISSDRRQGQRRQPIDRRRGR